MKNLFITDGATLVLQRRQEPDAHHHGARVARVGSHAEPHEEEGTMSLDRRTTIKWMFAAAAAVPSLQRSATRREPLARDVAADQAGYGTDPDLIEGMAARRALAAHATAVAARLTTAALCDLIIPADDRLAGGFRRRRGGLHRRVDQRAVSAAARRSRNHPAGLTLDRRRSAAALRQGVRRRLTEAQKAAIADDICAPAKAAPAVRRRPRSSSRSSAISPAGGFYTTPVGMKDIGYTGNVPLEKFDGPPLEALKKAGLA